VTSKPVAGLLERERELEDLGKALTEAQRGSGQLVLVEAPAGLGKTSLLEASFRTATAAGFRCLRARASELERDFAYGCVRQLLEPTIAKAAETERQRLFEGAAALSKPLFARSGAPHEVAPSVDNAFAMLHGLYWLLNNVVGEGPVAVYVDDLHWADTESVRFLNYLAPRLDGLPITVLASMRTGLHMTADLARLFSAVGTKILRPEPLSIEATAKLCELRFESQVDYPFAVACRHATGGNPFFLEALLREAKERGFSGAARDADRVRRLGPTAVARAVLLRLSGAPATATAFVRAAAVLGDGASISEAARFAGVSVTEAARAADLLIALALLKPSEGVEFAHPIVREAVYADIGSNERALAHTRAAAVLAACGASEERIAAQVVASDPVGEPTRVELLRRVAAAALAQGAAAATVAWLKRALAEPPSSVARPEVLLELGSAELRLAMPEAIEHLEAAVETIREPRLLGVAVRQLANALNMSGDFDRAVAALEWAIDIVEPTERELSLLLTAELAAKAQQARREARAPAASRLARHRDLKGDTPGERLVLASLAFEQARTSESASEAARHIERGLAGGRLLGEQDLDVVGPFYALVLGLLSTDELDLVETSLEQALDGARARASIPAMAFLLAHRGWLMLRRGAVALAEADARSALELLNAHDIELGKRFALAVLIWALVERGEIEIAEQELSGNDPCGEIPAGLSHNDLLEARGILRLAQGKTQAAFEDLLEFGRRNDLLGAANPLSSRWRSRACFALAATGDSEGARRMAAEDLERARRWGAATDIGIALRASALLDGETSVDRLREATDVLRRSPSRLELARALTDFGVALRHANRRTDARTALQEALELATACGADALAARAQVELRIAGGRSTDRTSTGLQSLTVSERRVAELAAAGHSNPEIAQTLFVTRKTVETHLGHVYSKLDISGRAQLQRALEEYPSRTPLGASARKDSGSSIRDLPDARAGTRS
jgi:DNA-binding CsgD family transcriptional regulator